MTSLMLKPNGFERKGPVLLIIMDGVGLGKPDPGNAVHVAKMPVLDRLMQGPLFRTLRAHGRAVGMPSDEDMGNSEVGHNALGAGRVFDQGATLVQNAICSGVLYEGATWKKVLANVLEKSSTLHFIGLLSDGNVHAHIDHVLSMTEKAAIAGVKTIRVHVLLDGRDVGERSALGYLAQLESHLQELQTTYGVNAKIASGGGRMVTTMDRYNADWTIVERGWKAHVLGEARTFSSATEAVETMYAEDPKATDQYLDSFVITESGQPVGQIQDGDSVVLFNFRGDRAIELSMAFELDAFTQFDRIRRPDVLFAGMMSYDGDLNIPRHFLVAPPAIDCPVGQYMCATQLRSFAISETQKYGHVTYFWNGNNSGYIDPTLESYIEIPSDRIQFDQAPAMKAHEITAKSIALLQEGRYDFGRINFPNGDMVGHTGVFEAAVTACEVTDHCVGQLIDVVSSLSGCVVVLADHGNADEMFVEKNGKREPKTAHTLNPVPFAIVDSTYAGDYTLANNLPDAGLANVAATLCELMGFHAPEGYAPSLLVWK
jgi:2,3-bisphosphoglycerate-independent phosphoglycerate mutase